MNILVTGGAGYIGAFLVKRLIEMGAKVCVVDNLSTGCKENVSPMAEFINADIRDKNLISVFSERQFDICIHLAAQISVAQSTIDPLTDADININGTINLLEYCVKSNVKKIIFISTAAVYGEPVYLGLDEAHPISPINQYGLSKSSAENYLILYNKLYGIKYVVLRLANVYGRNYKAIGEGGVVSNFLRCIKDKKQTLIFGDGNQTRDFIYVSDVIEAITKALDYENCDIFNIGSGVGTSINDLIFTLGKVSGENISPEYSDERKSDIKHSYFNSEKARKELNWHSQVSLEEGLKKSLDDYK